MRHLSLLDLKSVIDYQPIELERRCDWELEESILQWAASPDQGQRAMMNESTPPIERGREEDYGDQFQWHFPQSCDATTAERLIHPSHGAFRDAEVRVPDMRVSRWHSQPHVMECFRAKLMRTAQVQLVEGTGRIQARAPEDRVRAQKEGRGGRSQAWDENTCWPRKHA